MSRIPGAVRQQVRERANGRCEYCGKPDAYGSQSHQVDHIVSQKHHGSDDLDNLAWACFQCNSCKGTDIAARDRETNSLYSLFNPRTQKWDDHFRLDGAIIIGLTPIGRVTIDILQMNDPDQIRTRRLLIENDLWGL
ncbi:MAG: HNH endonuclease signature motif containing protein [Chloroflexota bacterium]